MQLELPLDVTPVSAPAGALRHIQLGTEIVSYRFRRARRRSIALVIDEDGLRVAAPGHAPIAEVEAFMREKARWLLRKLAERRAAPRPSVVSWNDGAMIALLGTPVIVELIPGRRGISLQDGRLRIGLAPRDQPAALKKRGIAWFKDQARALFGERLALYAASLSVPTPALALSSARTQWGMCREDGRIRLNWRLIHLPLRLIDYVVAHELAHLREMNHSPRFWTEVGRVYPDYQAARRELRACSDKLPIL